MISLSAVNGRSPDSCISNRRDGQRQYDKMRVGELVRRIQDDLKELLVRAYPTYSEEWNQRFAPNYWRKFPHSYEGYLRFVINKSVAEELCRGLWERIIARDKTVSCKACEEYQRLLP